MRRSEVAAKDSGYLLWLHVVSVRGSFLLFVFVLRQIARQRRERQTQTDRGIHIQTYKVTEGTRGDGSGPTVCRPLSHEAADSSSSSSRCGAAHYQCLNMNLLYVHINTDFRINYSFSFIETDRFPLTRLSVCLSVCVIRVFSL